MINDADATASCGFFDGVIHMAYSYRGCKNTQQQANATKIDLRGNRSGGSSSCSSHLLPDDSGLLRFRAGRTVGARTAARHLVVTFAIIAVLLGKHLVVVFLDALLLSDLEFLSGGGVLQGARALLNHLHPSPAVVTRVLQFNLEEGWNRFAVDLGCALAFGETVELLAALLDDALQRGERGLALRSLLRRGLLLRFELAAFLDEFRVLEVDLWMRACNNSNSVMDADFLFFWPTHARTTHERTYLFRQVLDLALQGRELLLHRGTAARLLLEGDQILLRRLHGGRQRLGFLGRQAEAFRGELLAAVRLVALLAVRGGRRAEFVLERRGAVVVGGDYGRIHVECRKTMAEIGSKAIDSTTKDAAKKVCRPFFVSGCFHSAPENQHLFPMTLPSVPSCQSGSKV